MRKTEKLSDKEIKNMAKRRLSSNGGDCVSLTVFQFSLFVLVFMCEATIYLIAKRVGWSWLYDINLVFRKKQVFLFWMIKLFIAFVFIVPQLSVVRRLFIDIAEGGNIADVRAYITTHSAQFYRNALRSTFVLVLIKFFAAVPGAVGVYGIYYWGYVCRLDRLTSAGLLCFMLCMGFTFIWIGVTAHYYISLALAPYIMALNPRTNIFDACDLSVKLMDGKHARYLRFVAGYLKYLPALLFVYPCFAVYPYFKISYTILMKEFLGDYFQDKMPGMIKRWRKYH